MSYSAVCLEVLGLFKVLLVCKKSRFKIFGLEKEGCRFLRALEDNPRLAIEIREEHLENEGALDLVKRYLFDHSVLFDQVYAGDTFDDTPYGLILTIGGDGTLLKASHHVKKVPVFGINSRPGYSVGHFCRCTVRDFQPRLGAALSGEMTPVALTRCECWVNGRMAMQPALNDLLFASANPAGVTEFEIEHHGSSSRFKSSGVWVATAAGSTAAIRSAGGQDLPFDSTSLQYVVREVYSNGHGGEVLKKGLFTEGLRIRNLTFDAALYVDGGFLRQTLDYGDLLEPQRAADPLNIFLPEAGG